MRRIILTSIILSVLPLQVFSQQMPSGTGNRMMWASICGNSNVTLSSLKYAKEIGKFLISWRMLPGDTWETAFDLYSGTSTGIGNLTKHNTNPIVNSTCFQLDNAPSTARTYYLTYAGAYPSFTSANRDSLQRLIKENALAKLTVTKDFVTKKQPYISIPLHPTTDVCDIDTIVYPANDVSVGDLDGDGEMEIIVKRIQGICDANGKVTNDGSGAGTTLSHVRHLIIWDAYKLDGTFLWRIKSGPNMMHGNSSAFAIADFDGDGRAEMAIRTSEGTVFGDGTEIGDTNSDKKTDYRTYTGGWVDHYCSAGPEFLSIIDGETGRELARKNFIPRGASEDWGDGYFKRANSLRIGVGCFDNTGLPSVIVGRGVYARSVIRLYDFRDGELSVRWTFDTSGGGTGKDGKSNSAYSSQGNHSLNVADLDGDGLDEIMYGSMALDDDGKGLWSTGLGHGDANHVGKFLPDVEGLQVWHCLESGKTAAALHHAKNGQTIWNHVDEKEGDCGRCMVADIDPSSPGCEFWWAGSNAHTADGKDLGYKPSSCNMGIWFDGSLTRQLLNGTTISNDRDGGRVFTIYRYSVASINGSKTNPSWYGDFLGDWREEVILPDATLLEDLKIFSTWYTTSHKFPWLMTDHTYHMSSLNQNIGYNQPNNLSYFLGTGMDRSKVPLLPSSSTDIIVPATRHYQPDGLIYDLSGRVVNNPQRGIYIKDGKKFLIR